MGVVVENDTVFTDDVVVAASAGDGAGGSSSNREVAIGLEGEEDGAGPGAKAVSSETEHTKDGNGGPAVTVPAASGGGVAAAAASAHVAAPTLSASGDAAGGAAKVNKRKTLFYLPLTSVRPFVHDLACKPAPFARLHFHPCHPATRTRVLPYALVWFRTRFLQPPNPTPPSLPLFLSPLS